MSWLRQLAINAASIDPNALGRWEPPCVKTVHDVASPCLVLSTTYMYDLILYRRMECRWVAFSSQAQYPRTQQPTDTRFEMIVSELATLLVCYGSKNLPPETLH